MRSIFHLPVAVLATVALFGTIASAASSSIKVARGVPEGTPVTVDGIVTVPSGSYDPNDLGFAIEAPSGHVGLYIHDSLGGSYTLGQKVRVTGTAGNSFGLVWGVYPSSIAVTGSGHVPKADEVATSEVNESTEGTIVRVEGTVTDAVFDDAPYGWRFHVDDGSGELTVFVYTGTGIDTSGIEPGDEVEITGFSGQFIDHYELNPRFPSDIVIE